MLKKISSPPTEEETIPALRLGFRVFFPAAASFGIIALITWAGVITQTWSFEPYGGSYWWHAHEMLFGFVTAAIAGFLLTAVQSWTGLPSIKGLRLFLLLALWLSARVLLFFNIDSGSWWPGIIDIAFLPAVAVFLATPIIRAGKYRNLLFVPILLLMSLSNVYMHSAVHTNDPEWLTIGSHAMVMLITTLMCILGGRVFPMFTANGTQTEKVLPLPKLEILSLSVMAIIVAIFIFVIALPKTIMASLFLIAALAHFYRWARWRFWVTLKTPLVWSLHLAYLCIPLGLLLFSFHYMGFVTAFSLPMHTVTVGAMGGMILAMMSRVSLGHTGQILRTSPLITSAFVLMALALLFRTLGTAVSGDDTPSLLISAALWCGAYGLFLIKYLPLLTRARADGHPG
ncbi:MAG: NnrS family protein [Gammaproteobacteria bacterium]|nr:NnrS family protein [Gammaproteobacteria bacterium]